MSQLSPKDPDETLRIVFDFTMYVPDGVAIRVDTGFEPVVTSEVASGADPAPGDMISGAAALNGLLVIQMITGGRLGTTYRLKCKIRTTQGEQFVLSALLPIDYVYSGGC